MSYEQIIYEVADRVATVTLNRPEANNGYTLEMVHELAGAFRAANVDPDVRVVVLTGAGERFCVGADLAAGGGKGFGGGRAEPDAELLAAVQSGEYQEPAGIVTREIFALDKPVIAAVFGAAAGVGSTMLLPCDYRLAAHGTKFGFPFTRRGIVPEGASAWFLPRLVGLGTAMDWLLSWRTIMADEALRAGLLHSLHDRDELLTAAYALANDIAANTSPYCCQ